MRDKVIHAALYGVAIGDALGVPVEFKGREYLKENPVIDYLGYLCWNQPPGTWSDDSSLTFCLAESLTKGYNLTDIANNFTKWVQHGYWGAHHKVFDIGGTTRHSILRLINGESPLYSGNFMEHDNGNGSLMRILPIIFYLKDEKDIEQVYKIVKDISAITHGHFRSIFACFIYVVLALELLKGKAKEEAYESMKGIVKAFIDGKDYNPEEVKLFDRILEYNIADLPESSIQSSGYVLHSLEASIWCLMTGKNFVETVLKAVNLGGDTDTTGAITGGLAGLYYGFDAIPDKWINQLARTDDICDLCNKLEQKIIK